MSVPVNLNGPSHVLEKVYTCDGLKMARSAEKALAPLTFPPTRAVLWDPTPDGEAVSLQLCYYRNPRLLLLEKALRLAHRHARQSNRPQFTCFFLGNIVVDTDEEGVTVTLDRFDPGRALPGSSGKVPTALLPGDPGRALPGSSGKVPTALLPGDPGRALPGSSGKVPTALLPGDILVPCVFGAQGMEWTDNTVFSAEDLNVSFKMLQHRCCSREPLDLASLLILRGLLGCSQQADSQGFSLRWAAVTVANTLDMVPVRAIPVIPTALARSLSTLSSLAPPRSSAGCKQGFLTMDKTRKLLLILESDPKAYTLPLVGVWLSGITHISHPHVWAWCLRYLLSSSLQDRVMSESGCFLVVLYSLTHREPEFYQCQAGSSAQRETAFQLLTGAESLTLYQDVEVSKGHAVQFELSAESQNSDSEFFREVLSHSSLTRSMTAAVASPQTQLSACDQDSGVEDEDLSPRPSPNPHPLAQQTKRIHPSVPELSLVMEGSFAVGTRRGSQDSSSSHTALPPAVQHRASSPDHHVHSGPRPPGQEAPLHRPPPLRRPLLPATHKGKGTSTPERQQPLGPPSNRKCTPPFGTRTKDGRLAPSSSSPSSGKISLSHSDSRPLPASDPLRAPVSLSGPSPLCSPECSPEPLAPALPGPQSHTRPAHFHSTPNSNLNQPCACCSTQLHNQTPIYPHQPSKGAALTPAPLHEGPGGHAPTPHWDGNPGPHWDDGPAPRPPDCCPSSSNPDPAGLTGGPRSRRSSGPCTPAGAAHTRGRVEPPPPPSACLTQYCSAQAPSLPALEGLAGLLPADAYRILQDQDRQLKLLHAQIQKLLEAQEKTVSQSSSTEQAAMQTHTQRVSIAVETGASLFWGDPVKVPSAEEPPGQDGRGESQLSGTSRRSSGVADLLPRPEDQDGGGVADLPPRPEDQDGGGVADLPPRPEDQDGEAEEQGACSPPNQSMLRCQVGGGGGSFQSAVLGESASMYYMSPAPARPNHTRTLDEEHKFYQELLGQVNSRLQGSVNEEVQEEMIESSRRCSPPRERDSLSPEVSPYQTPSSNLIPHCSWKPAPSLAQPDGDQVLSATLHRLKQLGVSVELDDPGRATRATVDSASTLAFIDPAAVLPRLALPESVGTSMWGPGSGVDLSLEANAIALKYLSDSQLARLSLGTQQSSRALLLPSVALQSDKSMTGLSLFSPSNMSLATQTYMRRYGLAEGSSSEEEREDAHGLVQAERVQQPEQTRSSALKNMNHEPTHSPGCVPPRSQNPSPGCPPPRSQNHSPGCPPPRSQNHSPGCPPPRSQNHSPGCPPPRSQNHSPGCVPPRSQTHSPGCPPPRSQHLDSQNQLLRDLLPKMQLLNHQTRSSQDQENCVKPRPSLGEAHRGRPQSEGSVGNFLDLSRLRQLPKLF